VRKKAPIHETGVLDPRTKLLRFLTPGLQCQKRGMVKAEKGDLFHSSGHAMGRDRVSTQLIFSHLRGTDMSYMLK
jgi:hypothetical protein